MNPLATRYNPLLWVAYMCNTIRAAGTEMSFWFGHCSSKFAAVGPRIVYIAVPAEHVRVNRQPGH